MKTDGLELDDDPAFEKRMHPVQVVSQWLLCAFVGAAALGFFGKSDATVKTVETAQAKFEYARVVRVQTADDLRFRLTGPFNGTASVWISQEYLKEADIQRVVPLPTKMESVGNRVRFDFAASGAEPMDVVFSVKPRSPGFLKGEVQALENGERVSFQQFCFY
jgi:hypothetical protein